MFLGVTYSRFQGPQSALHSTHVLASPSHSERTVTSGKSSLASARRPQCGVAYEQLKIELNLLSDCRCWSPNNTVIRTAHEYLLELTSCRRRAGPLRDVERAGHPFVLPSDSRVAHGLSPEGQGQGSRLALVLSTGSHDAAQK
jgi:hypothetical protein